MCASKSFILVTLVLLVALALQTVGFATPYWAVVGDNVVYGGLFKACGQALGVEACQYVDYGSDDTPVWLKAVLGLQITSLIFMVFSIPNLLAYNYRNQSRDFAKVAMFCMTIAGGCGLAGIIVFASKDDRDRLGWSFGLATTGSCLTLVDVGLVACMCLSQSGYMQIG